MATQLNDGEWGDTEDIHNALETLKRYIDAGKAKRFVIGTNNEIEEEKKAIALEDEVADLKEKVNNLEQHFNPFIYIPSLEEKEQYGRVW